jgi:hypothetical protein
VGPGASAAGAAAVIFGRCAAPARAHRCRGLSFNAQALIDAPGLTRRMETFKRLTLTDFTLDIPRLAAKKVVNEKWTSAGECPVLVRL